MTLVKHAINELHLLRQKNPDNIANDLERPILALIAAYGDTGQSGGSHSCNAPFLVMTIARLLDFKSLTDIEDSPEYWVQPIDSHPMLQHSREGRIFKDDRGVTFIEGIRWTCGNQAFWGRIDGGFNSSVTLPSLPWELKTFDVEVTRRDTGDADDWQHTVADPEALKKAYDHYQMGSPELDDLLDVVLPGETPSQVIISTILRAGAIERAETLDDKSFLFIWRKNAEEQIEAALAEAGWELRKKE